MLINGGYQKKDTGQWIEDSGFARRLLSDDNDGSRHQRIILQLKNRDTLLIAHNIDLAKRVPLGMGDRHCLTHANGDHAPAGNAARLKVL